MENQTIQLEIDREGDGVYIVDKGQGICLEAFFEKSGHDFSSDCEEYVCFEFRYTRACSEIEQIVGDGNADYDVTERLYLAAAAESLAFFDAELSRLGYNVAYDRALYKPELCFAEACNRCLSSQIYFLFLEKLHEDNAQALLSKLGIDCSELERACAKNIRTNGRAGKSILGEGGLLDQAMESLEEDEKDEELENNDDIKALLDCIYAMNVAAKRHALTDYDDIDKSSMSDEQVSELRRAVNAQV